MPLRPAMILAWNQDILADLQRDLEVDKLHNLHRYRAAVDTIQFVSVQVDLCTLWQRQIGFVWEGVAVVDGAKVDMA